MHTCIFGHLETMKVLVEAGADLAATDNKVNPVHNDGSYYVTKLSPHYTDNGRFVVELKLYRCRFCPFTGMMLKSVAGLLLVLQTREKKKHVHMTCFTIGVIRLFLCQHPST